jgi:hypothetical protein
MNSDNLKSQKSFYISKIANNWFVVYADIDFFRLLDEVDRVKRERTFAAKLDYFRNSFLFFY